MSSKPQPFTHPHDLSKGAHLYHQWCLHAGSVGSVVDRVSHAFCTRLAKPVDHDMLREIAKTMTNTAHASELLPPMLLWASQQPWADFIDTDWVGKNWSIAFAFAGLDTAIHIQHSASGIALSRDLYASFTNEALQRFLLDFWLNSARQGVWTGSRIGVADPMKAVLYEGWMHLRCLTSQQALVQACHPCPDAIRSVTRDLHWNHCVAQTMRSSEAEAQKMYMQAAFCSPLDAKTKLTACRLVGAEQWMDADMQPQLLALLPPSQEERLPHLHWYGFDRSKGELHIAAMNQTLLAFYCPDLVGLAHALATPKDWVSVTALCTLAQTIACSHATASDKNAALSLPIGCFDAACIAS